VAALIDVGADITSRLRGATALHFAAKAGFSGTVRVLLERGADANEPDDRGVPPLLYALRAGKRADIPAMRRILVEGGADDEAVRGV
jgi:ankyrin repeat protein